jgi:FMN-dependent NADH-azoreductase
MTKLLVVETIPRGDYSISRTMTPRFIAQWQTASPHGEILSADHIVIATPVHNYNVPVALIAWVDHIVR